MPIHLFQRDGSEKRSGSPRELNDLYSGGPALDFDFCDAHHPISMFGTVCCVHSDSVQLYQLEFLNELCRQG